MVAKGLVIETLHDAAVAPICDLAARIWREHYPGIIPDAQIEYMLARGYAPDVVRAEIRRGVQWFGARDATGWIGFAAFEAQPGEQRVYVHKLYVDANARRGGVGRELLASACALARRSALACLELRVNKRNRVALDAYARIGFERACAMCEDIGGGFVIDDWLMRLPVADP